MVRPFSFPLSFAPQKQNGPATDVAKPFFLVEHRRIELLTSTLPVWRAPEPSGMHPLMAWERA